MVEAKDLGLWQSELQQYKRIENMQIDNCHDATNDEDDDDKDDDEEVYYSNPQDPLNSPRIYGLTAISILGQFVQTLPHDRFTKLVPFFEFEEKESKPSAKNKLFAGLGIDLDETLTNRAVLYMPHMTPYREPIIGPYR